MSDRFCVRSRVRARGGQLTFRRYALLGVIVGTHLLLFSFMRVGDRGRAGKEFDVGVVALWWVDLSEPEPSRPATQFPSLRADAPDLAVRGGIAPPNDAMNPDVAPDTQRADMPIDWAAQARHVAGETARRMAGEKNPDSPQSPSIDLGRASPNHSPHRRGDSEHYEGGVIIDWVSSRCYYSNENVPNAAFGQALRLQIPVCTGASDGGAGGLHSFEDWKKERDAR